MAGALPEQRMIPAIKLLVKSSVQRFPDFCHKIVIKIEIMQNSKAHSEHFLRFEQMADISAGMHAACRAAAFVGNRARICSFI